MNDPEKKIRICHRCNGSGHHNIPPSQWQALARVRKKPAYCCTCKGEGVLPPPAKRLTDLGRMVLCRFLYADGHRSDTMLMTRYLPTEIGEIMKMKNKGREVTFRLTMVDNGAYTFREVIPLRLLRFR